MSKGRPDAINTNLALLSDEELYAIYIRALGYPKRRYDGRADAVYRESRTKRQLTGLDALLYFFLLAVGIAQFNPVGTLMLFGACVASLFNIIGGPFALGGYLYFNAMDSKEIEPPSIDTIRLHSPDALYFIADYLTRPVLDNARTLTKHFTAELVIVDRFLAQTTELENQLRKERELLCDLALKAGYDNRIEDANRTQATLQQKRDSISARIEKIKAETYPLERPLEELKVLSQAGQRLRTIQGLTNEGTTLLEEDDSALDNFAGLQVRIEMAKQNLSGLGSDLQAYEEAVKEVQKLGLRFSRFILKVRRNVA